MGARADLRNGFLLALLVLTFAGLAWLSPRFAWEIPQIQRPTFLFVGLIFTASAAFACLSWEKLGGAQRLFLLIAAGAALRLLMLISTPIWEDDFHRYLWDGGAVLAGLNPYAIAPIQALDPAFLEGHPRWAALAAAEGDLLQRINYPYLRTIYPGIAQLAFALGHALGGGDLFGLRIVLLAADFACLGLLLALLTHLGRSPLWIGLYWLNPIIAKEFINSAHIDALLGPLLLAAIWAALQRRPLLLGLAIGLAGGVKLWPILLWPLLARYAARGRLAPALISAVIAGGLVMLSLAPLLLSGLDDQAGLAAFADGWVRNRAWHPVFFTAVEDALRAMGALQAIDPNRLARALLALAGILAALAAPLAHFQQKCRRGFVPENAPIQSLGVSDPTKSGSDFACDALGSKEMARERLLFRAYALSAGIILLSPTQFPWYWATTLPLAVLIQARFWAIALALAMPAYYLRFPLDRDGVAALALAWGQHVLLWGVLIGPIMAHRMAKRI